MRNILKVVFALASIAAFASSLNARDDLYKFRPVSIARDGDRLLAVDYRFLWSIDGAGILRQIPVHDGEPTPVTILTEINPAGLYVHSGRVYLANYHYHNVIIGKIENDELVVERKLTHPKFVSPEGVSVTDDYIAVADYDGNSVYVFDHSGKLLREVPLPLAHGIAIKGEYVFASGLGGQSLIRINVTSGEVKVSSVAIRYPTTIQLSPHGEIAVIDVNAAKILSFNDDMDLVGSLEMKTGSGEDEVLRPYGFAFDGDALLVTDTYNYRVVRSDLKLETPFQTVASINRAISLGGSVPALGEDGCFTTLDDGEGLAGFYGHEDGSVSVCPQGVKITDQDGKNEFVAFPVQSGLSFQFPWGILWEDRDRFIFGDPANSYLYVIDVADRKCTFVNLPRDLNLFLPETDEARSMVQLMSDQFPSSPASCDPASRWAM